MHSEKTHIQQIIATLAKYRSHLLRLPTCTGIALGRKLVRGEKTEQLALLVFVKQKRSFPDPQFAIPSHLDGIVVDIIEQDFFFRDAAMNQPQEIPSPQSAHLRQNPLFCGVAIAPREVPYGYGSLGCFFRTNGKDGLGGHPRIAPGTYALTNRHVLPQSATTQSPIVIQPDYIAPQPINPWEGLPAEYSMGVYIDGYLDAQNDCAIVQQMPDRQCVNEVPTNNDGTKRKKLRGLEQAMVDDVVYKFGATTGYTEGVVQFTHFAPKDTPYQETLYICNTHTTRGEGQLWAAEGDSGSIVVRKKDDKVVGLLFRVDNNSVIKKADDQAIKVKYEGTAASTYSAGLAYDITSQLKNFGNEVGLV